MSQLAFCKVHLLNISGAGEVNEALQITWHIWTYDIQCNLHPV